VDSTQETSSSRHRVSPGKTRVRSKKLPSASGISKGGLETVTIVQRVSSGAKQRGIEVLSSTEIGGRRTCADSILQREGDTGQITARSCSESLGHTKRPLSRVMLPEMHIIVANSAHGDLLLQQVPANCKIASKPSGPPEKTKVSFGARPASHATNFSPKKMHDTLPQNIFMALSHVSMGNMKLHTKWTPKT